MKNINKYLLLLTGLLVGSIVGIKSVSAATLTYDYSGYYYDLRNPDKSYQLSWYMQNYYLDGKIAYCIEPNTPEGNQIDEGSWEATGLPNSIKERILLIAYYGATYPGHDSLEYRLATQGLLWETIIGQNVTSGFATGIRLSGTVLDVSAQKREINNLVDHHYDLPSFSGQTYNVQVGESITLTDTNNLLNDYDINISGAKYSINENKITITPTTTGTIDISFTKKVYYESSYKLFVGDGIQNLIIPGTIDPLKTSIRIKSYYSSLEINKSDSDLGVAQGQGTLEGAKYGIYEKNSGNLVTTIITNKDGYGKSDNVLLYGSYYLKEITASKGYYLDQTRYDFDAKGETLITKNVKEQVIKNYISILKQYKHVDGQTTFLNAESNITFEIYYPNNKKYGEIKTDKNGYATINIPYGVWKFHQVNATDGYEKIYDFYITVDENSNKEQYYNILNNSLSAYLQVVKIDSETGNQIALPNTTFKILNTETNQYISQFVGGKIYSEFKTDENGMFVSYLKLESGNYKLIEISSPTGYLINNEGIDFTIGNNTHFNYTTYGAFITINYNNQPIKGQIEINKTGELFTIENGNYHYDKLPLKDIVFNIYAEEDIKSSDGRFIYFTKGDLVDTITTNENGYAISTKLPLGKYCLKEIKTNELYILDENKYCFELKEIDNKTPIVYINYNLSNELKKGTLNFTKSDLVSGIVIPNTKIEIYTNNDELIYSGVTNKQGQINIDRLPIGKYYILETDPATGYILNDEKVYFEIKDNNEIVKANMTNKPILGILEFTKIDLETGKPLSNALIEIYNLENNELIYSGRTDLNGMIKVENIKYGNYYIIEKEAPDSYMINNELIYFSINEDGQVIKSIMTDDKIIIEVPNTESNDHFIIEIIGGILFIVGIGIILYAKKKK